ncbi:hypothetical protein N781_15730 [Pontibacillus halophilus JSM 076056 = DSM 19796]|uniref:Uncharacterized protein n=1 Tax=Pontibacillus halophilus JSM 076056 = DSM 19796 TaxID=1385510 RepID=A0A0A5GHS0_9BACI|nr:hypothetical protein [Pontibacillus halophilus]KGX92811.1 hypothetical protein N781_15730 [Pontibacillus halophilus JSM 076056 = DSM 19796]
MKLPQLIAFLVLFGMIFGILFSDRVLVWIGLGFAGALGIVTLGKSFKYLTSDSRIL